MLTTAQARAALLGLADMPTGWTQKKPEPDGDGEKITPARCAALLDAIDQEKPPVEVEASFSAGDSGPQLDHTVISWRKPMAPVVKQIASALQKCPRFISTAKDGTSTTIETTGLSFPNLGDRTLAVRMTAKSQGIRFVMDIIYIAKGNSGTALTAAGLQPLNGARLESLARKAVERIDAATNST